MALRNISRSLPSQLANESREFQKEGDLDVVVDLGASSLLFEPADIYQSLFINIEFNRFVSMRLHEFIAGS